MNQLLLILTGSNIVVDQSEISHTGGGRISRITIKPMSLFESKNSNGNISLQKLFELNDFYISNIIVQQRCIFGI